MSRWKKLDEFPDYLPRLSVDELREELAFWQAHLETLRHRDARKTAEQRVRTVRKVLDEKLYQERAPAG